VIKLQVAFVGTIDFDKKMITFDASLYESSILTMTLEGDMAVRLKWGENPDFILTIGGFHPSYTPPPLGLPTLRRLAINILSTDIAMIRIECYQAVTSNSIQFGAKAEIKFDLDVCSINGFISFDALFQFSPFHFIIESAASFSLSAAHIDIMSVHIDMSLEGPTPWRAKGSGSVSLLFFDISADFDKTWGESQNEILPSIAILPKLIDELKKQEQWNTVLSADKNILVTLKKFDETADKSLVLHPAGSLVVHQKILPLKVNIDKIGNQKTSDIKQIAISGATSNNVPLLITDVNDSFARAQYQSLSDGEKLSKPAFENLPAGVNISMGAAVKNGKMTRRKVQYEVTIVDIEKPKQLPTRYLIPGNLFGHFIKGHSVARSVLSKSNLEKLQPFKDAKLAMNDENFTVAFQDSNQAQSVAKTFTSELMAHTYLQQQVLSKPSLKNDLHIIPNYELQHA
ncbi:MAG TPA: DUF6603 domain-containing protein, partial [Ferruginibacter sp.]|nr:DUF6603 domain-containing protein [Ferruginibacter sp.]